MDWKTYCFQCCFHIPPLCTWTLVSPYPGNTCEFLFFIFWIVAILRGMRWYYSLLTERRIVLLLWWKCPESQSHSPPHGLWGPVGLPPVALGLTSYWHLSYPPAGGSDARSVRHPPCPPRAGDGSSALRGWGRLKQPRFQFYLLVPLLLLGLHPRSAPHGGCVWFSYKNSSSSSCHCIPHVALVFTTDVSPLDMTLCICWCPCLRSTHQIGKLCQRGETLLFLFSVESWPPKTTTRTQ